MLPPPPPPPPAPSARHRIVVTLAGTTKLPEDVNVALCSATITAGVEDRQFVPSHTSSWPESVFSRMAPAAAGLADGRSAADPKPVASRFVGSTPSTPFARRP